MINKKQESLVLIGMPGAGKSTAGALLAEKLGLPFIDTDRLIERQAGQSLQSIVDQSGYLELRKLEENVLLSLPSAAAIIATGGSAVYSEAGMQKLQSMGEIIYLDCSRDLLQQRIDNYETRGLARQPGQGLRSLMQEREPLYIKYADNTIDTSRLTVEQVVEKLCER